MEGTTKEGLNERLDLVSDGMDQSFTRQPQQTCLGTIRGNGHVTTQGLRHGSLGSLGSTTYHMTRGRGKRRHSAVYETEEDVDSWDLPSSRRAHCTGAASRQQGLGGAFTGLRRGESPEFSLRTTAKEFTRSTAPDQPDEGR